MAAPLACHSGAHSRSPKAAGTIALAGDASLGITCGAAAAGVCFRPRRGKEEAPVPEAAVAVGTFPCSASSRWGPCPPALHTGLRPSRLTVSLTSQAKSCLSPTWQGAGSSPAQGLKGSQGDSWAPAGGRAGDEGGRPPALEGEQHCLCSPGMSPGLSAQRSQPGALGTQEAHLGCVCGHC